MRYTLLSIFAVTLTFGLAACSAGASRTERKTNTLITERDDLLNTIETEQPNPKWTFDQFNLYDAALKRLSKVITTIEQQRGRSGLQVEDFAYDRGLIERQRKKLNRAFDLKRDHAAPQRTSDAAEDAVPAMQSGGDDSEET